MWDRQSFNPNQKAMLELAMIPHALGSTRAQLFTGFMAQKPHAVATHALHPRLHTLQKPWLLHRSSQHSKHNG